jgi:hypothetical protein
MQNEFKERSVIDVILKVKLIIPDSETKLNNELDIYINELWNLAPEVLVSKYCWIPFTKILNDNIPNINKDWHFAILKIINNKSNE